jgi:predicted AlkP superfamily phosphohydrolase/phosphomutase
MVTYDVFRVLSSIVQAVDGWCEGLWHEVHSEREDIIREAKGLVDEAVKRLEELIPEEYHDYVSDFDVASMAAAMALEALEGWWAAPDMARWQIHDAAAQRHDAALLRG